MNLRGFTIFFFLFSTFVIIQAKKYSEEYKNSEEYREFQEFKDFEEFKKWKKEKELTSELSRDDDKSLERNRKNSPGKELERNKNDEHSAEKSSDKQKWKDKKWKENKEKNFNKKNYDERDSNDVDGDDKEKSYELQSDERYDRKKKYERGNEKETKDERKNKKYEKYKKFEKMNQDYERITQIREINNDPPPINEAALMARYIVNQANWTSVATVSSRKDIRSFPSANVISFSDGIIGNGSGIPYMYLTPLDFTAQDVTRDNRASLMMTLAQGRYCSTKNYDPMDPRCARVILTGKIKPVNVNSTEIVIAQKAVFSRHPWLKNMPRDHHFFFAKLKILSIAMLDTFGGPKFVPVKEYLHPPTPNITEEFSRFKLQESDISEDFGSNVPNPYVILV